MPGILLQADLGSKAHDFIWWGGGAGDWIKLKDGATYENYNYYNPGSGGLTNVDPSVVGWSGWSRDDPQYRVARTYFYTDTYTMPAGSRPTQVQCVLWYATDNAYQYDKVFHLSTGAGVYLGAITQHIGPVYDANGNLAFPDHNVIPLGGSWNLPAGTPTTGDLRFEYDASGWEGLTEILFQIFYVSPPTVAVTAPATTVALSRPTVTWSYTQGLDGGPQIASRTLVYTQAQTVAGGFAVGVTTPIWDSGIVAGNGTSAFVSTYLTNSTTYVAYVQAAQNVNGDYHWSAWATKTFTISIAAPATPADPKIIVLPDDDLGRNRVFVWQEATPVWTEVQIDRSLDNGVTYSPMRNGYASVAASVIYGVSDYEAPNGVNVTYRVRASRTELSGGLTQTTLSTNTAATGSAWTSSVTWLKAPLRPDLNQSIRIVGLPSFTRRIPRSVYDVAGRSMPVVVSEVRHAPEGSLSLTTYTQAEAAALAAILGLGQALLLDFAPQELLGAHYYAAGDVAETRVGGLAASVERVWATDITEVDAPAGDIANPLRIAPTWDYVARRFATWATVTAGVSSWASLL